MLAFRIHREPSFLHALFLFEYLEYAPQTRTTHYTQYGAEHAVLYPQTANNESYTHNAEYPPAASAEVVFALDDDGTKEADDQKGDEGYK